MNYWKTYIIMLWRLYINSPSTGHPNTRIGAWQEGTHGEDPTGFRACDRIGSTSPNTKKADKSPKRPLQEFPPSPGACDPSYKEASVLCLGACAPRAWNQSPSHSHEINAMSVTCVLPFSFPSAPPRPSSVSFLQPTVTSFFPYPVTQRRTLVSMEHLDFSLSSLLSQVYLHCVHGI